MCINSSSFQIDAAGACGLKEGFTGMAASSEIGRRGDNDEAEPVGETAPNGIGLLNCVA